VGEIGDEGGDRAAEGALDEIADEGLEEGGLRGAGRIMVDAVDAFAGEDALVDKAGHDIEDSRPDDAALLTKVVGDIADGYGGMGVDEVEDFEFALA
jgi:hypothetical protein